LRGTWIALSILMRPTLALRFCPAVLGLAAFSRAEAAAVGSTAAERNEFYDCFASTVIRPWVGHE